MINRIHYLDAMRGVLMMLGVVLHSAQVFSSEQTWLVCSQQEVGFASMLIKFIRLFRIPAFYIVSGYFALLTLRKYGKIKFFKVRITRIVIPLITTAVTLNSLQAYLLYKTDRFHFELSNYLITGEWVSHLWFLINLVFYFILASFLVKTFKGKLYYWLDYLGELALGRSFAFIFFSPFINIGFLLIIKAFPLEGIINISEFLLYLPFFLFGMLLRRNSLLMKVFISIPPFLSLLVTIASIYIINHLGGLSGAERVVLKLYITVLGMWFSSSLCFYIFMKFTNYPSKVFRYLSEASYTVYLFHHVLVVGIGLLFIKYNIGGVLGFFLLVLAVTILSLLIHSLLISKIKILSILFNGKKNRNTFNTNN